MAHGVIAAGERGGADHGAPFLSDLCQNALLFGCDDGHFPTLVAYPSPARLRAK